MLGVILSRLADGAHLLPALLTDRGLSRASTGAATHSGMWWTSPRERDLTGCICGGGTEKDQRRRWDLSVVCVRAPCSGAGGRFRARATADPVTTWVCTRGAQQRELRRQHARARGAQTRH